MAFYRHLPNDPAIRALILTQNSQEPEMNIERRKSVTRQENRESYLYSANMTYSGDKSMKNPLMKSHDGHRKAIAHF
jgi:hypothetical protein